MIRGLIGTLIGLMTYIAVTLMVASLITGTSAGDTIITNILGLAIAIGVVVAAFATFLKSGGK
jgi:hypothetical protein